MNARETARELAREKKLQALVKAQEINATELIELVKSTEILSSIILSFDESINKILAWIKAFSVLAIFYLCATIIFICFLMGKIDHLKDMEYNRGVNDTLQDRKL